MSLAFLRKGWAGVFLGIALLPLGAYARTPNDRDYADLWYLPRISAPEAWDVTTGSADVVVAVIDTGVAFDHPDLQENLWTNTQEIPENGKDDDGNGFIDDVSGWDFVDDDAIAEPELAQSSDPEAQSHGTLVAGIVGAVGNNRLGYTGVAWDVRIMPLRVLDENGSGTEANASAAIRYAIAQGADIINLSFAGDDSFSGLRSAVRTAYEHDVVVVAALGNESRNVNERPVYPACLRSDAHDWVIGVAATTEDDEETSFTNYGSGCADISAPGEDIFGLGYDEEYIGPWSGTSMASPIVAGVVALLRAEYPTLHVDDVRTVLKLSVDPVHTSFGAGSLGAGRVNVARALEIAAQFADPVSSDAQEEASIPSASESVSDTTVSSDERDFSSGVRSYFALGARAGSEPQVRIVRADGVAFSSFLAYSADFTGGVQVALDDLNDDNKVDVVTAPGVGGGPQVRIFTDSGAFVHEFFAYAPDSRQGVSVALGDVTGDGREEIVTAVGAGVSNDVVVFDQKGNELSRFSVEGFTEGTRFMLAVGDVDNDWDAEIVLVAQNKEPRVAIYNADGLRVVDFLAYDAGMNAGLSVATGDLDGDDRDEIIIGPLTGGAGHVRIFNRIGALWGEFFTTEVTDGGGMNVAVADIDIDGVWDIVTAPHGHAGDVRVWDAQGTMLGDVQGIVPDSGTWLGAW